VTLLRHLIGWLFLALGFALSWLAQLSVQVGAWFMDQEAWFDEVKVKLEEK